MINLLLRRIMAFVSFLLITACASNTAAALDVPVATETPFDRAAALTLIAPTSTPTNTPPAIVMINPRNYGGTLCVGDDDLGHYAYDLGGFHQVTSNTDPYYEICELAPDGVHGQLKRVTSHVLPECIAGVRWYEDLSGDCLIDGNGSRASWEPTVTHQKGGD